jgi:ectoine hydroxylase-related dioxygenase (phytanoyl-CoA dioxygenase family)
VEYQDSLMELNSNGYAVVPNLYSEEEITRILNCLEKAEVSNAALIETEDLYAIRKLFVHVPELVPFVFTDKLMQMVGSYYESNSFLTKSIYFDKPDQSNWFVPFHQDLSISVTQKAERENYTNWTFKKGLHGVQPPLSILEDTLTVRIHLDNTSKENGALRLIPKTHQKGVIRIDAQTKIAEAEKTCEVNRGGVMLMKPLTLHASNRTTNGERRRVIHLEFNQHQLSPPLKWLEYLDYSRVAPSLENSTADE